MSAQTISDAFAPVEAKYRSEVMIATWGHLAPSKRKSYKGYIVFAVGCYDPLNPVVLECEFIGLQDSPWFFDALNDFISADQSDICQNRKFLEGGVYRFDGTFKDYEFKGSFQRLPVGGSKPTP